MMSALLASAGNPGLPLAPETEAATQFLTRFNQVGWVPGMARGCNCAAVLGEGSWLQELLWRAAGSMRPATQQCLRECSEQVARRASSGSEVHTGNGPIRDDGTIHAVEFGRFRD